VLFTRKYLRNQAGNISSVSENVRERVGETGSSLDSRVRGFTSVITFSDTKDTSELIPSDGLLDLADVLVEWASHILGIKENESSFRVKAKGQNIFTILNTIFSILLIEV